MTVEVTFPDPELAAVDYLTDAMPSRWDDNLTVGVELPDDWTPASTEHVQVQWDGTPGHDREVLAYCTVRIVAWSRSRTRAKHLCGVAVGALTVHEGGDGVSSIDRLTGVQPAKDPTTGGHIAAATVRMTMRSQVA